jgi:signal transduction histidine kinase
MTAHISLLLVEDSEDDAQVILSELQRGGLEPHIVRVDNATAMVESLASQQYDVVLSDYSLSALSGLAALKIVRAFDPDLPFVVISGAMGEETAVEVMRAGAQDYLIKGNLARLVPAIQREVREAENRRERRRASEALAEAKAGLQALSNRMLEIQEAERRRIARELHDEIGQALTAVKIHLNTAKRRVPEEAAVHLEESIRVTELALARVRELSLDLRPPQLDDLGLVSALRWQIDRQLGVAGIAVNFAPQLDLPRLPPDLETACFRVAQEAITNILRHASATEVEMKLTSTDKTLQLMIQDDGKGFDLATTRQRALAANSVGLLGMQERVSLVGGSMEIASAPGCGTHIKVEFPLRSSPADYATH